MTRKWTEINQKQNKNFDQKAMFYSLISEYNESID